MKTSLALIDCNNFFVSCERLFRPDLIGRPVVVLSSNDGCVVSRSNEAKALGVPMGAPVFKFRRFFKEQGVAQFSGNFELYGDISSRITRLLTAITPHIEVYSVDESFLDLGELGISDYSAWGRMVRRRLLREVGIPVSIGLAPSKTLAKLASDQAKRQPEYGGALDLITADQAEREIYLIKTPINKVWGVGWRLAPRLRAEGIHTAFDLSRMRPQLAQQLMGIHGRQMVAELNGVACHPLQISSKARQSVMHGRQFGEDTADPTVIESAVASLTTRATAKLRGEGLLAASAAVRLSTNRHKPGYQRTGRSLNFATPTADAGYITRQLVEALASSLNGSAQYHRADVLLYDIIGEDRMQTDLLGDFNIKQAEDGQARLRAFDAINRRFGPGTVHYAAEDLSTAWQPKRGHRSPHYTTDWQDLPVARTL